MKSTAMGKSPLFSAVLSLFLLVPASITWAQNVTLTGVVYENNMATIPFTVPEGKINVYLPDNLAARDQVSGTVSIQPGGTNEKQKGKNFNTLKQYLIAIGSAVIDPQKLNFFPTTGPGKSVSSFQLPDNWSEGTHGSVSTTLSKKNHPLLKADLPLLNVPPLSGTVENQEAPYYQPAKKIITSGENLVLQNDLSPGLTSTHNNPFLTGVKYYIDGTEVTPVCTSSRQTVIGLPPGTVGKKIITAKDKNGNTVYTDDVNVVDIQASIDNPNLQRNQRTSMHTSAGGFNECAYPFTMIIVNKNQAVVLLDKGIHQTYLINPYALSTTGDLNFHIDQGVTGMNPGIYNIQASLILPTLAYGDVFAQQKSVLKTAEDYNAWVDALKKDLKAYADKQGTDDVGRAAKANAERAIDNIPKCSDQSKLDECKALADAYLRPVDIPKGAATMWVCGFEAYKAAIKAITGVLGGKAEIIDWEVIKNGLEFIRNMGEQLNDESLQNGAKDARKMVEAIQKTGETKEKLEELRNTLDNLNNGIRKGISMDPSPAYAYTMNDLQLASLITTIPGYQTRTGTNAILNIDGEDAALIYSLGRGGRGYYEMELNPLTPRFTNLWERSSVKSDSPRNELRIILPPRSSHTLRTFDFKDALITEMGFPKMDAATKDAMKFSITFKPEQMNYKIGSQAVKSNNENPQKRWMPANFRITLGDFPCKKIANIDGFKFSTKMTGDKIGENRDTDNHLTPAGVPAIRLRISGQDWKPWKDWADNFEKQPGSDLKNGKIDYLDPSGNLLFSLPLQQVRPLRIEPVSDGFFSVEIKPGAIGSVTGPIDSGIPGNKVQLQGLVAYLDPAKKQLMVLPEYRNSILELIGARALPNGQYHISSLTPNRKPIAYDIRIFPSTPGLLFDATKGFTDSTKPEENKYKKPDAEFTDSNGTRCLFYKDAKCGESLTPPGKSNYCFPHEKFVYDPETKTGKMVPDGKYYKAEFLGRRFCEKGTSFCVEMYLLVMLYHIYEDKNCTREIDVEKIYNFTCQ